MRTMHLVRLVVIATSTTALFTSCDTGEGTPPPGTSPAMTTPGADMSSGDTDMSPSGQDMCTPLATCPAQICGMVDDGCGGMIDCGEPLTCAAYGDDACGVQEDGCGATIDCGACACDMGAPSTETCGPCGLGKPSCAPMASTATLTSCDIPSPALSNVLGEPPACDRIVYVSASAAPGGTGGASDPVQSIDVALAKFSGGTPALVVVGPGQYDETLVVRDGVHVVGGYRPTADNTWVRDETARPVVDAPSSGLDTVGIDAQDITTTTVVHHLDVRVASAPNTLSSYGVRALRAQGLVLSSLDVQAGDGGEGAPGKRGGMGQTGGDGAPPSCMLADSRLMGGSGGTNSGCPEADGGAGGNGGSTNRQGSNIRTPLPGEGTSQATTGGAPGKNNGSVSTSSGGNGMNGLDASIPGTPGAAGVSQGVVNVRGYREPRGFGGDGGPGDPGEGGGGGGGAGPLSTDTATLNLAPGGGGGGAGGCGGGGGTGGQGGGGSFGLFAVDSGSMTIVSSTFRAGTGGQGGAGGRGGLGGAAGVGSRGLSNLGCTIQNAMVKSGDGGRGGNGSVGGDGGGGGGGVSYGAYCQGTTPTIEGMVTFEPGQAALGGASIIDGEVGATANQIDCQ